MKTSLFRGSAKSSTSREVVLLLVFVIVSTVPFVNRAIHLDENTYLYIAHNVFRNFWFPQDFQGFWFGIPFLNLSGHSHPVGIAYLLALFMKLFHGDAEWRLRCGFLIFPLILATAGYFLSRRFTRRPLLAAALMIAAPAVLVFSTTWMPDVPMTTMWLLAVLSFMSGMDDAKAWKMWLAGVFLVAASLISYQAVFMAVLLAFLAWSRGERRAKIFLPLALPVVSLAVYWYAGSLHYGFFAAKKSAHYLAGWNIFGLEYFRQKVLGMFSTLGATTLFCFSLWWLFIKQQGWRKSALLLVIALALGWIVPRDYSLVEYLEYFVFASSGMALLVMVGVAGYRALNGLLVQEAGAAERLFFSLWVLGVTVYTVFLCEFSAARYVAAVVPPVVILIFTQVERVVGSSPLESGRFLQWTLVVTWTVSMAVAFADYQFVGAYRDYASWFADKYSATPGRIWVGTEAGLRYYMECEGAQVLLNSYGPVVGGISPGREWGEAHLGRPAVGDLLVRPASFLRYDVASDLELSAAIDAKRLVSSFPIRTYGPAAHAGLHGSNVGLLPFAFSLAPLDEIEVYRYNEFGGGFIQAQAQAIPPGSVQQVFMTFGGTRRAVIGMLPATRFGYSLIVPGGVALTGKFGVGQGSVLQPDCAPQLSVTVSREGEKLPKLCSQAILPTSGLTFTNPGRWVEFSCVSAGSENVPAQIIFRAENAAGDQNHCPMMGVWDLQWLPESPKR
jgi:4-amino-4-deoxy-L-arabinose transferase-like glycosyltransferase